MQIVFLNTFEKPAEGNQIDSAQLSICEQQGVWSVLWVDMKEEAAAPETWFEGTSWEEMIAAFRYGIAKVMGDGFTPIIDGMLEDQRASLNSQQSMLQCYGELHANQELFQSLREWRRATASTEKKSAYLVATNRILWMISAYVPHTEEELSQIPGWGQAKSAAYGAEVLGITAAIPRTTSFPLNWVAERLEPNVYTKWLFKQKEAKYKNAIDRNNEKKLILTVTQQGGTLEQLEAELALSRRELLNRLEQLEQEGYSFDLLIERELLQVPEAEQQLIWDALSIVGDRYLKPILQQVYGTTDTAKLASPIEELYEKLRLIRLRFRSTQTKKAG